MGSSNGIAPRHEPPWFFSDELAPLLYTLLPCLEVGMAVLAALGIYLEVQSPFQKYLVPDTIWRYSYPYVENSIPSWALPVIGRDAQPALTGRQGLTTIH